MIKRDGYLSSSMIYGQNSIILSINLSASGEGTKWRLQSRVVI